MSNARNLLSPGNGGSLQEWYRRISSRNSTPTMYIARDSLGNIGGVDTDLHSYQIKSKPGTYFWKSPEQYVRVTSTGTFASNANNKSLNIRLGLAVYPFTRAINGGNYHAVVEFYKPDVSTVLCYGIIWTTNTTFPIVMGAGVGYAAAGVRLGEGAIVKTEVTSLNDDDVIEKSFRVELIDSPNAY